MSDLRKTVFFDRHVALGARIVEFGGWQMPLHYQGGIIEEHLATRKTAGLFDVSHMGRFVFSGPRAPEFLQHVLTNNAAALEVGQAQYTIIPNAAGGAVDDAYLYRFVDDAYHLVVNASNAARDWAHFQALLPRFPGVEMTDRSEESAMLSLQGPQSREILSGLTNGRLPDPEKNALCLATIQGAPVMLARTGYTGEPLGFELFINRGDALMIWDLLTARGAKPIGLGARDTLRLEAGLPLYGHELGADSEGREIPIYAIALAKFAVSFSPLKGEFVGREALLRQHAAMQRIAHEDFGGPDDRDSPLRALPRMIMPLAVAGRAIARPGARVFDPAGRLVGHVTSGTTVPCWQVAGEGLESRFSDEKLMRSIALALVDSSLLPTDRLVIEIRDKKADGQIVAYHLRSELPPLARAIACEFEPAPVLPPPSEATPAKVRRLLERTVANTLWRQRQCLNLIPSEMTLSPMARLLTTMDPAFRYAEHKTIKALNDAEAFYYQGTEFICEVELLLEQELRRYLGAAEVETRVISGQMANAVAFSAMCSYLNRANRRTEPRRLRKVLNNHIMKGGHLSSQPMGALKDFIAIDPTTEKPAVVAFPVLPDNPYKIDVAACRELLARHRPELIIFGKSMVLHPEPVREVRAFVTELGLDCVVMYDMAHVLGLVGPHFQEPFKEGADIVTGSTHKTFFGTQRGLVAMACRDREPCRELWHAVERRTFPGAVSNHHLGTLLGLLMAAYEMNHFKDEYQRAVLANAKAFARALKDCGLNVAGDPAVSYTETHQVIVQVGYGLGPEMARRLEESNIICNYQASPGEEGFSAAGSLRLGVAEMTRFGMTARDFEPLAELIRDVVIGGRSVVAEARSLRRRFLDLKYCFAEKDYEALVQQLHDLI